jgi:predicted RecB family nuclease
MPKETNEDTSEDTSNDDFEPCDDCNGECTDECAIEDLETIAGVGTEKATKLNEAGVPSVKELIDHDAEELADATDIDEWRLEDYIEEAKERYPDKAAEAEEAEAADETAEEDANAQPEDPVSAGVRAVAEGTGGSGDFEERWATLTATQKKVAQEYVFKASKADAARAVGLAPSTVYSWPEKVWELSERLVDRRAEGLTKGMSALSANALQVLRRALDPDENVSRVEKEAAEYIIDQIEGKPTRKQQVEHSGGIDLDESDADAIDDALSHLD